MHAFIAQALGLSMAGDSSVTVHTSVLKALEFYIRSVGENTSLPTKLPGNATQDDEQYENDAGRQLIPQSRDQSQYKDVVYL